MTLIARPYRHWESILGSLLRCELSLGLSLSIRENLFGAHKTIVIDLRVFHPALNCFVKVPVELVVQFFAPLISSRHAQLELSPSATRIKDNSSKTPRFERLLAE